MAATRPVVVLFLALLAVVVSGNTASPTLTYATGPSCVLNRMQCGGAGVKSLPCCSPGKNVCKAVPGEEGKYCVFRNERCYETTSTCDSDKPCCDRDAVCKEVMGYDGKTSKGKKCELTCCPDDIRCGGERGKPYVEDKPCCNPDYVCRSIGGGLWGKFCSPKHKAGHSSSS